jgi:hypothetical protein
MNYSFPTSPNLQIAQRWGNINASMYPAPTYRHMGLDIAGRVGAPIYAAADGVVADVSLYNQHGYGRFVIIQHEDGMYDTLYAHLHKINVMIGDAVVCGQQIGEMGGQPGDDDPIDGASSGSHLHFEVILPNQPSMIDFVKTWKGWTVDPLPYLTERAFGKPGLTGSVIASSLYIRSAASATAPALGGVAKNDVLKIVELVDVGNDQWARLWSLRPEFAAVKYDGSLFISVSVSSTTPNSPPAMPLDVERSVRLDEVQRMIKFLEQRKSELS